MPMYPHDDPVELRRQVTLVELVDRLLDEGVVISGEITLAVADVDLVLIRLRALLAGVESITEQEPEREPNP
jgi:Gas vesicle protein